MPYKNTKDRKEYHKKRYQAYKKEILIKMHQKKLDYPKLEWAKRAFSTAKRRAKAKNREFLLQSYEDLIAKLPEKCPVFGIDFNFLGTYGDDTVPAVDRIDSSKGYTIDNIQIISMKANSIKSRYQYEDIQKVADWLRQLSY